MAVGKFYSDPPGRLLTAALASVLRTKSATAAQATPIRLDGTEANLQQIVNNLTIDGSSSVDVVNGQTALDQAFEINSVMGGSGMIVLELAGYAGQNRLGLYDINNPLHRLQLFGGPDGVGAGVQFAVNDAGQVFRNYTFTGQTFDSDLFGFYLETPVGLWFSQSHLNADNADHLVAWRGQGDLISTPWGGTQTWGSDLFLLGWEDLSVNYWDQDYNDFMLFVGGVQGVSVPEPATMSLLALGLAGLGVFGRRRRPS